MCFLHDDGVSVGVACLFDVAPFDVSDIAESESCEAAEHETHLDLLVWTWCEGELRDFFGEEEFFDDSGSLGYVAVLHVGDGVGADGLLDDCFVEHALEGTEVVVGCDA